jgi:hypothetical protein
VIPAPAEVGDNPLGTGGALRERWRSPAGQRKQAQLAPRRRRELTNAEETAAPSGKTGRRYFPPPSTDRAGYRVATNFVRL